MFANNLTAFCLLVFATGIRLALTSSPCDVNMWYTDMLVSNRFPAVFNEEQEKVKLLIETIIKYGDGKATFDCDILRTYERLFAQDDGEEADNSDAPDAAGEQIVEEAGGAAPDQLVVESQHATSEELVEESGEVAKDLVVSSDGIVAGTLEGSSPDEPNDIKTDHETIDEVSEKEESSQGQQTTPEPEQQEKTRHALIRPSNLEAVTRRRCKAHVLKSLMSKMLCCYANIWFNTCPVGSCPELTPVTNTTYKSTLPIAEETVQSESLGQQSLELDTPDAPVPVLPDTSEHAKTNENVAIKIELPISNPPGGDDNEDAAKLQTYNEMLRVKNLEYTAKMSNLETQVLRLENAILQRELNKESDTSTMVKLENEILKLEKELTKVSHEYTALKRENLQLKKEQTHLTVRQDRTSTEHKHEVQMLNQYQTRLSELADHVKKQTNEMMMMSAKTSLLQQHNLILQEMVQNQSKVISSLGAQVEEIVQRRIREELEKVVQKTLETRLVVQQPSAVADDNVRLSSGSETPTVALRSVTDGKEGMEEEESGTQKLTKDSMRPQAVKKRAVPVREKHVGSPDEQNSGTKKGRVPPAQTKNVKNHVSKEKVDKPIEEANDETRAGKKLVSKSDERDQSNKKVQRGKNDSAKGPTEVHGTATDSVNKKGVSREMKAQMKAKSAASVNSKQETTGLPKAKSSAPADANVKKAEVTKPAGAVKSAKETSGGKEALPTKQQQDSQKSAKAVKTAKKDVTKAFFPDVPIYHTESNGVPKDCYDYFALGRKRDSTYAITLHNGGKVRVFCDMKNGGWTTIMRRIDGSTDFFRSWTDYKQGFGGTLGDHWIGNDIIHDVTNSDDYVLRIELTSWDMVTKYAEYSRFRIEDESGGYRLHIEGYSGDAGDAMSKHNLERFSTRDRDNDKAEKDFDGSCARRFSGGWWYYKCYKANLTGRYYRNGAVDEGRFDGISWKPLKGPGYSFKKVVMKIIPRWSREGAS